jgi:DNA-binding GntR family transcriptional regulator
MIDQRGAGAIETSMANTALSAVSPADFETDLTEAPDSASPRERVVRDVIRGLYEGRYKPGQRLVEAQLTATYGISRGPVREALNRLAASGIVVLTPERGAEVRHLSIKEAIDTLIVVQGLIGIAARLAATNIARPGAVEQMNAAVDALLEFDPASGDAEHAKLRGRFYAALTDTAGNTELSRVLPNVQIHLIRVQFYNVMKATDRTRKKDYRQIADAVLAGRGGAAEAIAKRHIGRAIEALTALLPA